MVADNDHRPDTNFQIVRRQIERSLGPSCVPAEPLLTAAGPPRVTVMMLPWRDTPGTLESLCVQSARESEPILSEHIDTFAAAIGQPEWESSVRKNKMWLRTSLAARHRNPFVFLGKVFREDRGLIPLSHNSFDTVSSFVSGIANGNYAAEN